MILQKTTIYFSENPKKLFLIDCIGAFVTLLGLLLMGFFNQYFGMAQIILNFLAIIAGVFCMYDVSCLFLIKENWRFPLKIIGIANLIYCIITAYILFFGDTNLTMLDFVVEIIIVCLVAYVELNTINNDKITTLH